MELKPPVEMRRLQPDSIQFAGNCARAKMEERCGFGAIRPLHVLESILARCARHRDALQAHCMPPSKLPDGEPFWPARGRSVA